MFTHPFRRAGRLALGTALAGALAASALAGPAMAADDAGPSAGKAGGDQQEPVTCRKAGGLPYASIISVLKAGDKPDGSIIAIRKAGGREPDGYIIGVL
jgi:hypothetical protein